MWMSLGMMFGFLSGIILNFRFNNLIYITLWIFRGFMVGIILGSISSEKIKIKFKKCKKKK